MYQNLVVDLKTDEPGSQLDNEMKRLGFDGGIDVPRKGGSNANPRKYPPELKKRDRCGLSSFVSLERTSAQPMCPTCNAVPCYKLNNMGVELRYRLKAMVDRASDQGAIPHLVAEAVLRKEHDHTFLLLGVDVRRPDGSEAEVDFYGVHAGKIIAGEAKMSTKEFSEDQIRRDVELSKILQADIHLMTSPDEFGQEQTDLVRTCAESAGLGLIVVEGNKLTKFDV